MSVPVWGPVTAGGVWIAQNPLVVASLPLMSSARFVTTMVDQVLANPWPALAFYANVGECRSWQRQKVADK